jgi:hypothetical protein
MTRIAYATREQVLSSPEVSHSAYASTLIDAKILSASDGIDNTLHKRFYPERRTVLFDWPQTRSTPTWQIDLAATGNEMISVASCLSGDGTDITASVILRRADDKAEPPYDLLEIDLETSAAFTAGSTWQRAITVTGLYSDDKDTATVIAGAALSGGINSSVTTLVLNPSSGVYTPGVLSLILMDTERIQLLDRRMSAVSGQSTTDTMDILQSDNTVGVTSGSAFAAGETILIDSERMRVLDIAGNTLIVRRAWDGTTLASHSSAVQVYALRTFSVARGVLGSTAASHSDAASVYVHEFPPLINEWCIAESVLGMERQSAAYGRGNSENSSARGMTDIEDVRARAWKAYGRKGRKAAI